MNKIPVVFITDSNFMFAFGVALTSMLVNAKGDTFYEIYLFHSPDVKNSDLDKVSRTVEKYKNASIKFINMGNQFASAPKISNRITNSCYYKLCIAKTLSDVKKVIYIDVDTIVRQDLSEMYDIDISDYYLGGVLGLYHYFQARDLIDKLSIPSIDNYINAGVMLMNLEKIRADKMEEKLQSYIGTFADDQDIMNKFYYGKIKLIHPKWNLTLVSLRSWVGADAVYPRAVSQEAYNNPAIMHYAGELKPWVYYNIFLAHEWMYYHIQGPFSDMKFNLTAWVKK